MKVKLFFAWYDGWIGYYWDRYERALYVCPLPWVVIKLSRPPKEEQESGVRRICKKCRAYKRPKCRRKKTFVGKFDEGCEHFKAKEEVRS